MRTLSFGVLLEVQLPQDCLVVKEPAAQLSQPITRISCQTHLQIMSAFGHLVTPSLEFCHPRPRTLWNRVTLFPPWPWNSCSVESVSKINKQAQSLGAAHHKAIVRWNTTKDWNSALQVYILKVKVVDVCWSYKWMPVVFFFSFKYVQ